MTKTTRSVFFAAATIALAACTSTVVRSTGNTPVKPRVSTPKYGATAVVHRGDTLYGIAFRNGLDVRDLAAWNGIGAPYTVYPGQSLRLYPRNASASTVTSRPPVTPVRTQPVPPATGRPATTTTTTTTPPVTASTGTTAAASSTPATSAPTTPVASDITWRWPADGQLLTRFVAGEPTKQGVDIAGDGGAPVKAAADGVVVYSGSGLVGYGELIIVKHNDAWLSAYGHNRARMVNEGAIVKAGQQIAVMGRTGAPRDMLHFEIRYNGKPVDPLTYLPRR
jgi:lipoprotein NlpD